MLFNSYIYFVFLGIVLPVFYFIPGKKGKNIFLLLASYFFYGYWDWRFCSLLAFSTLVDFFVGMKIAESDNENKRKFLLSVSLVSNLGILGIFKYFNFFVDSFQSILGFSGLQFDFLHLNIILPVGISFYTFQTLSYTIDIYRGRLKPTKNFIDFSLFVAFFPQLVAGPIERAKSLLPQLDRTLKPTVAQLKEGGVLIVTGLFRKVMIGDTAGRYVDHIFANLELYKSDEILFALILFSIQIYADFSGYSHIARGTAKLLGVELMKNFEQPYLSKNITEFWRRWHISLSSWLKDYLYISLGGNRRGKYRTYMNLLITMLLGGLWHGASWNFVIWGGLHGIYLACHKILLSKKSHISSPAKSSRFGFFVRIVLNNILVLITWVFFRSTSWSSTKVFFSKVVNWSSGEYTWMFMSVVLSYCVILFVLDFLEYKFNSHTYLLKLESSGLRLGILSALLLVTFVYMFQAEALPFIYFQF